MSIKDNKYLGRPRDSTFADHIFDQLSTQMKAQVLGRGYYLLYADLYDQLYEQTYTQLIVSHSDQLREEAYG